MDRMFLPWPPTWTLARTFDSCHFRFMIGVLKGWKFFGTPFWKTWQ